MNNIAVGILNVQALYIERTSTAKLFDPTLMFYICPAFADDLHNCYDTVVPAPAGRSERKIPSNVTGIPKVVYRSDKPDSP